MQLIMESQVDFVTPRRLENSIFCREGDPVPILDSLFLVSATVPSEKLVFFRVYGDYKFEDIDTQLDMLKEIAIIVRYHLSY